MVIGMERKFKVPISVPKHTICQVRTDHFYDLGVKTGDLTFSQDKSGGYLFTGQAASGVEVA